MKNVTNRPLPHEKCHEPVHPLPSLSLTDVHPLVESSFSPLADAESPEKVSSRDDNLVSGDDVLQDAAHKVKAKSLLQKMWDFLVRRNGIGHSVAPRDSVDDRTGIGCQCMLPLSHTCANKTQSQQLTLCLFVSATSSHAPDPDPEQSGTEPLQRGRPR